jgi:hypothetical protein
MPQRAMAFSADVRLPTLRWRPNNRNVLSAAIGADGTIRFVERRSERAASSLPTPLDDRNGEVRRRTEERSVPR